jgi:hypothetical protein
MAEAEKTRRDKPADGTLFERLTPELSRAAKRRRLE